MRLGNLPLIQATALRHARGRVVTLHVEKQNPRATQGLPWHCSARRPPTWRPMRRRTAPPHLPVTGAAKHIASQYVRFMWIAPREPVAARVRVRLLGMIRMRTCSRVICQRTPLLCPLSPPVLSGSPSRAAAPSPPQRLGQPHGGWRAMRPRSRPGRARGEGPPGPQEKRWVHQKADALAPYAEEVSPADRPPWKGSAWWPRECRRRKGRTSFRWTTWRGTWGSR